LVESPTRKHETSTPSSLFLLSLNAGGRFLARGIAAKAYEHGVKERTVVVEFESLDQAIAAHDSPEYQAALAVLGNGAERDLRIVEGIED
jgi:uncharacterized protein (DUF1330 family)